MALPFDTGTLSWVRDEIDLALERAGRSLARYAAAPAEGAQLAEAREGLHQACSALTLVGLAGVSHFAETVEVRLADLATAGQEADVVAVGAAAGTALAALRRYLDGLMAGQPDQPLALYPAYRALALAAGLPEPSPADLFFPDLSLRPPRRPEAAPLPPQRRKALRLGFARGLAKWRSGESRGLVEMKNAVAQIEQGLAEPAERAPWWIALAWFETPAATDDPRLAERLLDALDRQIEAYAGGLPAAPPDALLAGMLYGVATAPISSERIENVRAAYRLADLLPAAAGAAMTRREACRAPLVTAMEDWERCAQGDTTALPRFHDVVQLLAATARDSNDAELARLAAAIAAGAARLKGQAAAIAAPLAFEMASALILVEEAIEQEGAREPGDEALFAAAVSAQIERLETVAAGNEPPPPAPARWRERRIVRQAADAIRAALEAVEENLGGGSRGQGEPAAALAAARAQLHAIAGGFALLGEEDAARIADAAGARLGESTPPADEARNAIAEQIATLAQFADSLKRGAPERQLLDGLAMAPSPQSAAAPVPAAPVAEPQPAQGSEAGLEEIFVEEAREVLMGLAAAHRQLAARPDDRGALAALRRGFHTLKGSGRMVELTELGTAAHACERLLERRLDEHRPADPALLALLERARSLFERWVEAIGRHEPHPDPSDLVRQCEALLAGVVAPPAVPVSPLAEHRISRPADEIDPQLVMPFLEEATEQLHQLGVELQAWRAAPADGGCGQRIARLLHTFKGGARMCGAMSIGELAHGMETRVEQALSAGGATPVLIDGLTASLDRVSQLVDGLRQAAAVPAQPAPAAAGATRRPAAAMAEPPATVLLRVRAELIDHLVNEAGEMAIARARIEQSMKGAKGALLDLGENIARLRSQLREFEIHAESSMPSRLAGSEAQRRDFDPLELDRFTRLQELTRMMTESVNDVATVQHALRRQLEVAGEALLAQSRHNRELSHALLAARMVPFSTVAERLHRIVRQTAKELGRQTSLDIRGGDTPVDRNLLERMLGPLEHLLRNAVAHGIEPPQARRAAGKAELGEIVLTILPRDHDLVLTLADDGAGLDFVAIRRRAEERGLLAAGAPVDDESLAELIFRPGFSTAAQVSAIAGRGIGLDVVREEVSQLGGQVEVAAATGKGTEFKIVLPLTLAVIPVMLVSAAGRSWAIPAALVEAARQITPAEAAAAREAGSISHAGYDYPWHDLPRLLDLPVEAGTPAWQLLLASGGARIALEAEALTQNLEVVVKPLGAQLARVPGITGATVLPDGSVTLIVNPVALARRTQRFQPVRPATPPVQAVAPLVMVVDDSLTVRKISGRLLERAGYRVATAKDGIDALEQIARQKPDVILADIEMPRMDGFELVRALAAEPRFADLPVIMITSRIAERHRQLARELGVRHYLGKPYDEAELLRLISGLTQG